MRSRRAPRVTRDRTRATTSTIDFRVIYPTRTRARPAPARARASPRHSRTDASIIHHPATPASHPSIHPSIHDALARAPLRAMIVTYLARAHGDRSSSLRRVLDVGRHHGRGAGESRSHDWSSWSRCDDLARLAHVAAPRPLTRSIARRGLDAWSRSVDRGGGRDGRRAKGRPNVRTHTAGWRDRRDRGRDMGARGRTLRARARPRRCG